MLNGSPKKGWERAGYYCFHCLPRRTVRLRRRGVTEWIEHAIHHERSRSTLILTYCYTIPQYIKKCQYKARISNCVDAFRHQKERVASTVRRNDAMMNQGLKIAEEQFSDPSD